MKKRESDSFSTIKLLKEDFNLLFGSWKEIRKTKKIFKELHKKGLYTKKTYKEFRSGKLSTTYDRNDYEFLNLISKHFIKYSNESLPTSLHNSFGGYNIKPSDDISRENFRFKASIDSYNNKFFINLSQGTFLHIEYLSILYATVGCIVPELSQLVKFKKKVNEVFLKNMLFDDRTEIERISNPEKIWIAEIDDLLWQKDIFAIQGLLAFDLIKALTIFLIGHEFGHIINQLSSFKHLYQSRALEYCHRNKIKYNASWIEELSCDIIGFQYSIRFLKETNYHRTENGVFYSELLNFKNPISFLLSRNKPHNILLIKEDFFSKKNKDIDCDTYVLMIAALKVWFYSLSEITEINDEDNKSHPPFRTRLNFLLEDLLSFDLPELFIDLTNSIDMLWESMSSFKRHSELDHPNSDQLSSFK